MHISLGSLRHKELLLPKSFDLRPTTSKLRMQVFNICQHSIEDALFLDLFSGTGIMGFEALSRGARHCAFVEQDKTAACAIKKNIERFQLEEKTSLLPLDALIAVKKLQSFQPFSLVYIDPPYDLVETPYFSTLLFTIDKLLPVIPGGMLFIETRRKCKELPLSSFTLRSHRRSGSSELWQFEKTNL